MPARTLYTGHPFWPFSTLWCVLAPVSALLTALQARAGALRDLELSRDGNAVLTNLFLSVYGTSLFLSITGCVTLIFAGLGPVRVAGRWISPKVGAVLCGAAYLVPWILLPAFDLPGRAP
jgi:hypothetical protein